MNKNAFRQLSYGVYVVSTWDRGRATGCVANSVMQVTSDPATIAVSINHENYTNSCVKDMGKFAISVLGEGADPGLIGKFGFQSGKDVDKFDGVGQEMLAGMPALADACAVIACEVIDRMETSTHTVFLGKVLDADVRSSDEPMTYAYYHKVVKGKSPKNAPTYIPDETGEGAGEGPKEKYVCGVCGYVYDGDVPFEDLPDDYVCPICKQPKSAFRKE